MDGFILMRGPHDAGFCMYLTPRNIEQIVSLVTVDLSLTNTFDAWLQHL